MTVPQNRPPTIDGSSRRDVPANRSRWLAVAYIVVVALVLGAAFTLLQGPASGHASAGSGSTGYVIAVDAYMSGFSISRIDAKVGQPITISLRSMDSSAHGDGGGKHQLAIDEFGVNIIAPPKGVTEFTFTPDKAGTFVFYCDICCGGKVNPTMRGEFVVSES